MNYYIGAFKKYATFSGRATRSEFWYFGLFNFLILFAIGLIGIFGIPKMVVLSLSILYVLLVIIPAIAVTVRRLHDINYSGWWFLVTFIPVINIVVFILMLLSSDPNNNKYNTKIQENNLIF